MSDSRPTHPRKGREGKGIGREGISLQDQTSYLTVGGSLRSIGFGASQ